MRIHHDQYLKLREKEKKTFTSVMDTFWPKKAQTLSAWLLLIVNGLLPFSFCENECARQCMKQGPISCKTLMKHLSKLTVVVEKKITEMLPEKFAIVLLDEVLETTPIIWQFLSHFLLKMSLATLKSFNGRRRYSEHTGAL